MDQELKRLIAEVMKLHPDDQRKLLDLLLGSGVTYQGQDAETVYEQHHSPSPLPSNMTRVTIVLPDDLAKQARAEGLLAETRLADLLRRALHEQRANRPADDVAIRRR